MSGLEWAKIGDIFVWWATVGRQRSCWPHANAFFPARLIASLFALGAHSSAALQEGRRGSQCAVYSSVDRQEGVHVEVWVAVMCEAAAVVHVFEICTLLLIGGARTVQGWGEEAGCRLTTSTGDVI